MSELASGRASTLVATDARALAAREAIGGRRLRRGGRVLLAPRQLMLSIRNAFDQRCDVPIALGERPTEPRNLLRQARVRVAW